MVCHDRLLIGPPLFDDHRSSRSNTTSCAACANGWLVDACRRGYRARGPVGHTERRLSGYCLSADRRSRRKWATAFLTLSALKRRSAAKQPVDSTTALMDRWMDHLIRPPQPDRRHRQAECLG